MLLLETPLQAAVHAATTDPERLAYWLDAYGLDDLCDRLGCAQETALRLHLYATPLPDNWLPSLRAIARELALPCGRLSLLLSEALREGSAADEPRAQALQSCPDPAQMLSARGVLPSSPHGPA